MKICEFEKLKNEYTPQKIIYMHTSNKIYLTPKQINTLIELREEKIEPREHMGKPRKVPLKNKIYTFILEMKGGIK